MKTIETTQESGADKLLRLTIPVDEPNRRYHLVVVVVPEENATKQGADGWPEGYSQKVFGSIQDDSFIRHPQGEYEKRLEFE